MTQGGVQADFNLEVNDSPTLLDLVEAGLGVALIAEALVTPRRNLRTVALRGPTIEWAIAAVALAPGPTNPAARELWGLITGGPSNDQSSKRS